MAGGNDIIMIPLDTPTTLGFQAQGVILMRLLSIAVGLFIIIACVSLIESNGCPDAPVPKGNASDQTVALIGPIPLGDLFRARGNRTSSSNRMKFGQWPDEDDIITQFNRTHVWIGDSKRLNLGEWKLDFRDDPLVLVEGALSFTMKGKTKKEFVISIKQVSAGDSGFGEGGKTRRLRLIVRLDTSPYNTEFSSNATGYNFSSGRITWDLTGVVSWEGKVP